MPLLVGGVRRELAWPWLAALSAAGNEGPGDSPPAAAGLAALPGGTVPSLLEAGTCCAYGL